MGWFDAKPEAKPAGETPSSKTASSTSTSSTAATPAPASSVVAPLPLTIKPVSSKPDVYATDPVLSKMPRPSNLFEFGPLVNLDQDFLRGVCTSENPDAIQACTWSLERVERKVKPKGKRHAYRIEF
ncbi:MAG: hypothetical protein WDW38_010569 [Sanguina aurantia]